MRQNTTLKKRKAQLLFPSGKRMHDRKPQDVSIPRGERCAVLPDIHFLEVHSLFLKSML